MQPIISIVGRSESGKTTLLEGLIAELKGRGHRVAVVKHSAEDVEVDTVNKDTWRFTRAGSQVSAICSGHNMGVFKRLDHDVGPEAVAGIASDCDIILAEGFKRSNYPKIEVHRREQGAGLLSPPHQLIGVVTDEPLEIGVPQFSRGDIGRIADLIEGKLREWGRGDVDVSLDGTEVAVKPAFADLLTRTLLALASHLRDIRQVHTLDIRLRRKQA